MLNLVASVRTLPPLPTRVLKKRILFSRCFRSLLINLRFLLGFCFLLFNLLELLLSFSFLLIILLGLLGFCSLLGLLVRLGLILRFCFLLVILLSVYVRSWSLRKTLFI